MPDVTTALDATVSTRIIREEAQWDALRREWDELYLASPYASTPLDFTWLRHWWRVYGARYGNGGLRVVTVWRASRLLGVLPLFLSQGRSGPLAVRRLRFVSTGEEEYEETCPDYLNLLCLPGEEAACARAAWRAVRSLSWDHLDFRDLPEDSPLLRHREPASRGAARTEVVPRGGCPVADLAAGFETYLTRLSPKTRQHARQYIRAADRAGATLELATGSDTDAMFDDLVRLHQQRWTAEGQPGCFAAARFTEFHRGLARAWVPGGRVVLARLAHGGRAFALIYGFVTRSKFDFYQSGVVRTDTGPFESPGTAANLLLMRALAQRGVTAYDFLRGSSASYKERLATDENRLVALRMWRPTLRALGHHVLGLAGRAAATARRAAS